MEVKRRMMIGAFVLSSGYYDAYYIKALQVKALIKKGFDDAFAKYDIILGPTAPTTALKMGENLSDPLKMYLGDIYTVSVNLAGLPGYQSAMRYRQQRTADRCADDRTGIFRKNIDSCGIFTGTDKKL